MDPAHDIAMYDRISNWSRRKGAPETLKPIAEARRTCAQEFVD